jgi:hypothetical protein
MQKVPASDQVTEWKELAELETIEKTLRVIINLTAHEDES